MFCLNGKVRPVPTVKYVLSQGCVVPFLHRVFISPFGHSIVRVIYVTTYCSRHKLGMCSFGDLMLFLSFCCAKYGLSFVFYLNVVVFLCEVCVAGRFGGLCSCEIILMECIC